MWYSLQVLVWTTNPWHLLMVGYVIGGVAMFVGMTAFRVWQIRRS